MQRLIFFTCLLIGFNHTTFAQIDSTRIKERLRTAVRGSDFTVSLVRLMATPERYHGKTIQLVGYLNLEFEGNAIYLHKEDFDHGLCENAFWVDVSEKIAKREDLKSYNKRYVIIVGTFDMNDFGHMNLFGGTIKNITRLDVWR
jgi:hypothetical protein